jgi:SAM-dependent methyltransferase
MAIAMLESGHEVLGIDSSPEMIARLQEKARDLDDTIQKRLRIIAGQFAAVPPTGQFDAVIAPDDFTTHLLSPQALGEFFATASGWLRTGGQLITDLRVRDEERLSDASLPWPKPVKTFGIVECKSQNFKSEHVCMRFWEEYDADWRILTCNQVFEYIGAEGVVDRTVFKVIRQRVHTHGDLVEAARHAGFHLVAVHDRKEPTHLLANPREGGYYRFEFSDTPSPGDTGRR